MTDELKNRLKKIQALAERGVGGEKESAQKKLEKLLADNNITEFDLAEEKVNYYLFSYSGGAYRERLLRQVFYKVLGHKSQFKIYRTKGTRNKYGVYCTPAQKLEIDLDFEFYCNLFENELEILLSAFIQKQELFPEDAPHESINFNNLTPQEREEFIKRRTFEDSMSKRQRAAGMIEDQLT